MRILCITSSYPLRPGMISGSFVAAWARALEREGHELKVLTWQGDEETSCIPCMMPPHPLAVRYAPDAWQRLFHGSGAPEAIDRAPWLMALLPAVFFSMGLASYKVARKWRPELIVGHWILPSGFIARWLGHALGVPSLIVTHSGGIAALDGLPRVLVRPLADFLVTGAVTCVSDEARSRLVRHTPLARNATILPMGFDAPTRCATNASRGVLMLGRAVPIKGGEEVIRAYAMTRASRSGEPLHVVGDGPQRMVWERLAASLGIEAHFHGTLTGAARDAIMASCRLGVFGSRQLEGGREEGLPVSVLECAAAGVVPMVAHVPAAKDWLASPLLQQLDATRSLVRWAAQIDVLYEHVDLRALRLAQRARVEALEWQKLGTRWASYVEGLE